MVAEVVLLPFDLRISFARARGKEDNDWHGFLSSARGRGTTAGKSFSRRPRPVDDDDDDDDETRKCVYTSIRADVYVLHLRRDTSAGVESLCFVPAAATAMCVCVSSGRLLHRAD